MLRCKLMTRFGSHISAVLSRRIIVNYVYTRGQLVHTNRDKHAELDLRLSWYTVCLHHPAKRLVHWRRDYER